MTLQNEIRNASSLIKAMNSHRKINSDQIANQLEGSSKTNESNNGKGNIKNTYKEGI